MGSSPNVAVMRCQICANANDCPPADAARLFSADDLLEHIYGHLNYRPHKCKQCAFAASSPSELIVHSEQTAHYQLSLYNAENTFLKGICQDVLEKCRRMEVLAAQQHKTQGNSSHLPFAQFADGLHCSQSSSPIPSLNSLAATHFEESMPQQRQIGTFSGESKMASKFAMQLNALSTPNDDKLPTVPRELRKAVDECILGVSEVFASTQNKFAPNAFGLFESTKTALNYTSFDQRRCILCGNISNSNAMREYHSNTHLNLPLFGCRLCAAEFTKYVTWRKHMKDQHQQRDPVKFIRLEANWTEMRKAMREMFVPIEQPTNSSSNNTLAEQRTRQDEEFTIKTEHSGEAEERSQKGPSGNVAKKMRTLSKVQCAECDEFLPDTETSRLHHTNVKHLNLCLYKCHLCHREFTSTSNGLGCCVTHIKHTHPGELLPYDEQLTMADLPQKMHLIRARAAELFALNEQ